MWVIYRPEDKKFVARANSEHSYTNDIIKARKWDSEKLARTERCENEIVLDAIQILRHGAIE